MNVSVIKYEEVCLGEQEQYRVALYTLLSMEKLPEGVFLRDGFLMFAEEERYGIIHTKLRKASSRDKVIISLVERMRSSINSAKVS